MAAQGTVGLRPQWREAGPDPGFFEWLATQPPDVQDRVMADAGQGTDWRTPYRKQLEQGQSAAYQAGKTVPGVTATGAGLTSDGKPITPGNRAIALGGRNIGAGEDIEAQYGALGLGDYTYQAGQEQGPGYAPQDRYQYADPNALPGFEAALEDQAIDQTRTDTTGIGAQKGVLGEYASLYQQGGLNAIDRARIEQARRQRAAQGRSQEQAIMQQQEERGRAGGNAQLLGQMLSQQGVTNARSQDDLNTMALGLQRRDALLRDQAGLGGEIQSAQDAIDQFNTLGERQRTARNVEREQQVRGARFEEGAGRERENAAAQRGGVNLGFEADVGREARNVDRTTEASRFSVTPEGGRRGMVGDRAGASAQTAGYRQALANTMTGKQIRREEAEGAAEAALLGATTGAVQTGLKYALPTPKGR